MMEWEHSLLRNYLLSLVFAQRLLNIKFNLNFIKYQNWWVPSHNDMSQWVNYANSKWFFGQARRAARNEFLSELRSSKMSCGRGMWQKVTLIMNLEAERPVMICRQDQLPCWRKSRKIHFISYSFYLFLLKALHPRSLQFAAKCKISGKTWFG